MNSTEGAVRPGCRHRLVVVALLFWFGLAPFVSEFFARQLPDRWQGPTVATTVSILIAALAVGVPSAVLVVLLRGRPGRRGAAATAASLLIGGGYVVIDAAIRAVVPQPAALVPLQARYTEAGLRLGVLVPYAAFATWLAPRLVGVASGRSVQDRLGIRRPRRAPVFLALAVGALVTLPWPVTGALGDSLDSLALSVQTLVRVIPEVLVFWGVILHLLTTSLARRRGAAATTILVYTLTAVGRFLPQADWSAPAGALFLLPLALLLTEVYARGGSLLPLFPLAFSYLVAPALFVDPRDAIANGIPEIQHVASYLAVGLTATVTGAVLWLGRRVSERRRAEGEPGRVGWTIPAMMAAAVWGLWIAVYLMAGEPGFHNHGFLIILEVQTDLQPAYAITDRDARRSYVYRSLVETAESTQSAIRAELDDLDAPYRPYYVINMLRVDGHRWLVDRFEGRPGVAGVILNPNVREYPRRIPLPYEASPGSTVGVQENLAAIHADAAWDRDVQGAGIVVGGQDTGYDWDHPALKPHYRGWDGEKASHQYNWHDAWDATRVPFDDGSHGTHTMGIVLGDGGAGNRIGVAPEARWVGCRNMRRGFGNPGSYAECMEFLLAPYPFGGDSFADGDVSLAPHVVNNSWGCPDFEGCLPDTLKGGVEALRAAGTMIVVSAGNEGPGCGTAGTPPANYEASFSVGATTVEGTVVGFSSRGPVDGLIKPDIAAPGERIRSSVPGGGYAYAGGTSMAAPHVVGAIALVWSADPTLIGDVEGTEDLLCRSATPRDVNRSCATVTVPEGPFAAVASPPPCACGDVTDVPNNVYGCGLLDAGAAVESVLED